MKKEAELLGEIQAYKIIIGLYTGATVAELESQAVLATIGGLCQTPTPGFDCNQMKGYYTTYVEIKGYKDTADQIASIWKDEKSQNNP